MKITDKPTPGIKELILHNLYFWICGGITIALLTASFLLPPTGVIDPSVLGAAGIIFAFATLGTVIKAMDKGIAASMKYKDAELNINKKKQEEDN